jgi:prepilin-type processing-associated H-X9-DG protein/prepilin-type N-terminal cleavage/methylation domain-containing protein
MVDCAIADRPSRAARAAGAIPERAAANAARVEGFTLIELLVAIAILVTLVSILLPVIFGVAGRGDDVKCQQQLRQLGLALVDFDTTEHQHPKGQGQAFLADLFRQGAAEDSRILICPCSEEAQVEGWQRRGADALAGKLGDPVREGGTSYWGRLGGMRSIRAARARRVPTSPIPVACDACERGADGEWVSPHGGKVHVLFLDGHVEAVALTDFVAETWAGLGEHPRRVLGR